MAKVEQRHKLEARRLFSHADFEYAVGQIEQALADAEAQGAEQRQGGADGLELETMRNRVEGFRFLLRAAAHMAEGAGDDDKAQTYREIETELADTMANGVPTNIPAESRQQQASGWVPVSERLPEPGQRVLVLGKDYGVSRASGVYYLDDDECSWYPGGWGIGHTSHWMPLPPPPASE